MDTIEYLEQSIELLVMLQYGKLSMSCVDCPAFVQKDMNCAYMSDHNTESTESVEYIPYTNTSYYSCPQSMIPKIVYDLYDKYAFIQEFNTPLNEDITPSMFWWFVKVYKRAKSNLEASITEDNIKKYKP